VKQEALPGPKSPPTFNFCQSLRSDLKTSARTRVRSCGLRSLKRQKGCSPGARGNFRQPVNQHGLGGHLSIQRTLGLLVGGGVEISLRGNVVTSRGPAVVCLRGFQFYLVRDGLTLLGSPSFPSVNRSYRRWSWVGAPGWTAKTPLAIAEETEWVVVQTGVAEKSS